MKKQVLLLLATFAFFQSSGQIQLQDGVNQNLMLITTKDNDRMNNIEGSPYLNEEFQYGIASVEGKQPLKVFMRYNAHQDQIEIKTDPKAEETYVLPKDEKTIYKIGPETFVYDQITSDGKRIAGYFIQHYDGENLRLLEKPVVSVTEPVKAKTGYDRDRPARIVVNEEYFVVNEDGEAQNVRLRHRDIKRTFDSDRAKSYLSDNKVRSEQDFVSFISFLDGQ